ncbi:MAG: M23 family metallopeptidase [Candidatus Binataceae bacterium]
MLGESRAAAWPRLMTAVIVALLATTASILLFFNGADTPGSAVAKKKATTPADVAGIPAPQYVNTPVMVHPAPEPIIIQLNIERSESVGDYLRDAGLDDAQAQRWAWIFEKTAASNVFERGHSLTLYRDPETGGLRGLKYDLDDHIAVHERSYGDGIIRPSEDLIEYVNRPVAVAFKVGGNFWLAAAHHDVPEPIVRSVQRAFAQRQPLRGLPRDSSVRLIYQEKVSRDGSSRLPGALKAAQLEIGHETLSAFAFQDQSGRSHFYDSHGDTLGVQSLRFPLKFISISSRFSYHRWHPILHEYRPHLGVDLTARYGTPVKAIADGRVEAAGWCGELGRCVRILHEGGMTSIYGHLSRISAGLRPGDEVRMGQVIGHVGSTGLSTGPHLHFAIEKDGRFVNPLTQHLGVHHQVSPRMRALFNQFKRHYVTLLNDLPKFGGHYSPYRGAARYASQNSGSLPVDGINRHRRRMLMTRTVASSRRVAQH